MASHPEVVVEQVGDAEHLLHPVGPDLGDRHLAELLVDDVVLLDLQARDEARELGVSVSGLLALAADDQWGARLVDEDVVHLVHDGEEVTALDPQVQVGDQVVAEVVEPELVVRAVHHVRGVRLATGDRPQVAQPLVGGAYSGSKTYAASCWMEPTSIPSRWKTAPIHCASRLAR